MSKSIHLISLAIACLLSICFISNAKASPTLITIAEEDSSQISTWWPDRPGIDVQWVQAFKQQGVDILDTTSIPNPPRISAVVYTKNALSDRTARSLASLFGTNSVLNGTVQWKCDPSQDPSRTQCKANITLSLLYDDNEQKAFSLLLNSSGRTKDEAQKYIITDVATQLASSIIQATNAKAQTIPKIDKKVFVFSPIPNGNTIVALRQRMKKIASIKDVSEKWTANKMLAIEPNPGQPDLSDNEFNQAISQLINDLDSSDNIIKIKLISQDEFAAFFQVDSSY